MNLSKTLLLACMLLAACEGNPFVEETDPTPDPDPDPVVTDGGINGAGAPVTTGTPSRERTIVRREARNDEDGSGFVAGVTYTAASGGNPETFTVDGLAFDGGNVYQRDNQVGSLGPFAVYEADALYSDDVTGVPINQFTHRAIYGVSRSGRTQFALVRTGAYTGYGFGGFVYQRNGSVTLPATGQASYSGAYAGLRDFDGAGGLEYTTADMTIDIDFNDFNEGDGVKGRVYNRAIRDINNNDITDDVVTALNTKFGTSLLQLPVLLFQVGPGALDANGEMGGGLDSTISPPGEAAEVYEDGTTEENGGCSGCGYYAVISGDATSGAQDEIVGVIVVESEDPRAEGVTARETGGFLLYRAPAAP